MDIRNWKPACANDIWKFMNTLRRSIPLQQRNHFIYINYLLYLRNKYDKENILSLSQLLEKKFSNQQTNLEYILKDHISEQLWNTIKEKVEFVSNNILETIILDTTGEYLNTAKTPFEHTGNYTPDTLAALAVSLLDIKEHEAVYDICGGIGNFTVKAFLQQPKASYYSKEISTEAISIMEIRRDILMQNYNSGKINAEIGNVFDVFETNNTDNTKHFDKVFGNYPWMIDIDCNYSDGNQFLQKIERDVTGICNKGISDWIFNFFMLHMMKDSGKAIGIMTNGSTWNQVSGCRNARKYFLENGLIEAVIALPSRIFKETSITTTLIVFSHGNKKVRMIDATHLCVEKMRQNVFTDENIAAILKAYKEDSDYSILVSVKDILEKNDTVIHPKRYLVKKVPVKNGKPLRDVLKEVYRGAAISAKELDRLLTDKPSEYQYIMLKQINDGIIDENLPYLSELDKKYEKFIAPNHSVIISKIGTPFKCAVIDVNPERKILVNGNMFILKVDEAKVNPYYLKALFESTYGTALLSNICIGSIIPALNKKALEELEIPLPSLEKQNKIANNYLAIQDEIKIYRMKLTNALEKKIHIFDEMQGE